MLGHGNKFMVVEARAAQRPLIHIESERVNEMQPSPDIGAQTDDVAGIGRNLRLIQNQVEHDNELLDEVRETIVTTALKDAWKNPLENNAPT